MKGIIKNTLSLTVITVIMGILLGAVHHVTAEPIAYQEQKKKEKAYQAVFPEASSFETVDLPGSGLQDEIETALSGDDFSGEQVDEAARAIGEDGSELGYVLTVTTPEGYGGEIQLALGISADGTVQGISFLEISETAGLGMRADTDAFKSQFQGKQVEQFTVTKNGASKDQEIDALSGATITSNAVTGAVNAGLRAFTVLNGEGGTAE